MKKFNNIKSLIAAVLLLLITVLPSSAEQKKFHILMINDPHSYILPFYEAEAPGETLETAVVYPVGGMTRALRLIVDEKKRIEQSSDAPIFLFEAGDMMLGMKGSLQNGHAEYTSLAQLAFDAGVLGNHEFDGGITPLAKLGPKLKLPILASNITFDDPAVDAYYPDTAIIERDGVRIGIFGLLAPDSKSIIADPTGFSIDQNIIDSAKKYVGELRAKNVDAIVAINHMGLFLDQELASKIDGINVIVGGHSHNAITDPIFVKNPSGTETLIGQAGLDGRYAGRFDVTVEDGKLVPNLSNWQLMTVEKETELEPKSAALGKEAQHSLASILSIDNPVAYFDESTDARPRQIRKAENAVGDLIADALRRETKSDIGLIGGGSLRIGRIIPPGPFYVNDALDLMPFYNKCVSVYLSGKEIRKQLDISASALLGQNDNFDPARRTSSGEFLQVSGLRFDIDLNGTPAEVVGRRLVKPGNRVKNIMTESAEGWVPLDDNKIYSVGTTDFASRYFDVLQEKPTDLTMISAVNDYIGTFPGRRIMPKKEGRINIIGK
ncbi:MAG: bifunctional metallophosphatase/5'-nucleotidase [Synergistes sp.]|nr:bifunctional metallophosphatase/5'-nucleotidase [Synergistes sp.]